MVMVHVQPRTELIIKRITVFSVLIPLVSALSFNYTSFTPNEPNITYEKAYPSNNVIQLTRNQRDLTTLASVGRATYPLPLPLWDKASGSLTSFTTKFVFVINSLNGSVYGDGIAFFLAPVGSSIPVNLTKGGSLGLTPDSEPLNCSANAFFAVEFDIYQNDWDPPYEHVGIDINSMESVVNVTWMGTDSVMKGRKTYASISYDSNSKNLTVGFSSYRTGGYARQKLTYTVDLRDHLPELVTFGFSAATGNASALHSLHSWSFSSTLVLNDSLSARGGVTTDPEVGVPGTPTKDPPMVKFDPRRAVNSIKNKMRVTRLFIGLSLGMLVTLGIFGLLAYCFWKKKKGTVDRFDGTNDESIGYEFERDSGPKKFSYNDLSKATSGFSLKEKLGEGGFGGVYKGFLKRIDSYVAVKRVSSCSKQGIKEYASEVKIISRVRHKNLVQLLGWCHEKKELLLVYEFMPNGSLDSHLFGGRSVLNWGIRHKIAQGLASALLYLHEEWEQCVVHRDIKSSNVMLDANFNAKLGDFGLARLVNHEKKFQTTMLAGTLGYMAPECVITGKVSKETDVFSLGVVLMEIASGRQSIEREAADGQVSLIEWAWGLYGAGQILDMADPLLGTDFNLLEMEHILIVGLWCAHPDSNQRPSIRQAIHALNFEVPLPTLECRAFETQYYPSLLDIFSSQQATIVSVRSEVLLADNTGPGECSKFSATSGA